ncbi:MAG: DUF4838 domain-containing protein [Phycisphaerae bacterium]|nr:DUF4838 domain-containing protein [Phycisphaerae bacterium]
MRYSVIVLAALIACGCATGASVEPARVAVKGSPVTSVVVGSKASDRVRAAGATLAEYLGRISSAKFKVIVGDGATGLAVGLAGDFPKLGLAGRLAVRDVDDREHYLLKSHSRGVHIIGATESAVEHAVWDLLYRLGHRQFFPGPTWEVIPRTPNLSIAVNADERPDYRARRIWYGFGLWDHNRKPYEQWCARNRAVLGFNLRTNHAYQGIIGANRKAFDANPEFYGLLDGKRTSTKICIGNPKLRALVAAHAIRYFEKRPDADSISMDPSDGGGWCQCDQCAKLGSVSDHALTLANAVADAVNRRFKNKYVGMYAYSQHSPPPNIRVHPNVVISVATGFIRGGYTVDELIEGWAAKGATIGMREYYSVIMWSRNLPGRARGTNLEYLRKTIPHFHAKGARFMSAESGDCWGPCGLGYYLAARMLWDVDEAKRTDALVDDFLTRAFGPAAETMGKFYRLIDGANQPLLCDDLLGQMYRLLDKADKLADTSEIRARIGDLVLYTHYVELFRDYRSAKGVERQAAFERLIRHSYRIRGTMMVHSKAIYRDVVRRDKQVAIPSGAEWGVSEARNPWKSSKSFSRAELKGILAAGIAKYKVVEIKSVEFGMELVPATPLKLAKVELGSAGSHGRGVQTFYTWIDKPSAPISLKVTGGLIAHYRDRGDAKVELWRGEVRVANGATKPDDVERTIVLQAKQTGLHKITVSDGNDATRVRWPDNTPMTIVSSRPAPANLSMRWSLYFYVPKGAKTVGLFADGAGTLLDGSGNTLIKFDARKPGFHSIPVPKGQSGKLWKFHQCSGKRILLNVPPQLARNERELLLPKQLVDRDSK